jgi:hypothetical protein
MSVDHRVRRWSRVSTGGEPTGAALAAVRVESEPIGGVVSTEEARWPTR